MMGMGMGCFVSSYAKTSREMSCIMYWYRCDGWWGAMVMADGTPERKKTERGNVM